MADESMSEKQVQDVLGDQPDEFARAQKRVEMEGGLVPHENLTGGNNPIDQQAPTDDVRDPEGDSGQPQTTAEVEELRERSVEETDDEEE